MRTPEEQRAYDAAYYATNREKRLQQKRAWGAANRELHREKQRLYVAANREAVRERRAARYRANAEKIKARARAYRLANAEAIREHDRIRKRANTPYVSAVSAQRRARIAGAPVVEKIDRVAIIARDKQRCHICGKHVPKAQIHLDHIIPLAGGGEHSARNLAVAHARCNQMKGARAANDQLRMVG